MAVVGRAHHRPYVVLEGPTKVGHDRASMALVPPSLQPLLALLCLSPDVCIARETILNSLWPDVPTAKARARLSTALWRLRTLLDGTGPSTDDPPSGTAPARESGDSPSSTAPVGEPDAHATQPVDDLLANPPLCPDADDWKVLRTVDLHAIDWTDPETAELRRRLETTALRNPQDLAQGCDHEWVVDQRVQLELISQRTLSHLVEVNAGLDQLDRAILLAETLTTRDELREDGHRWLMRLYARAGRRADAIRRFERCRDVLQAELGVEPMAETVELADIIRSGRRFSTAAVPVEGVAEAAAGQPIDAGETAGAVLGSDGLGFSLSLGADTEAVLEAVAGARRALAEVEAALRQGETIGVRP